jgi:hypothetical protein
MFFIATALCSVILLSSFVNKTKVKADDEFVEIISSETGERYLITNEDFNANFSDEGILENPIKNYNAEGGPQTVIFCPLYGVRCKVITVIHGTIGVVYDTKKKGMPDVIVRESEGE